jgi:hypothetical protein
MALALVAIRIVFPDVDEFADELLMKHEEDK